MLIHTNEVADVYRTTSEEVAYLLLEDGGKILLEDGTGYIILESSPSPIFTSVPVYLQPKEDTVETGFDGEGAFKNFLLMTRGIHDIQIGDKFVINTVVYYVRGAEKHEDLTGKHMQIDLTTEYD